MNCTHAQFIDDGEGERQDSTSRTEMGDASVCLPVPALTWRDLLANKNPEQLLEELNQQGIVSMTAEYQYDAKGFWICKLSVYASYWKRFERVGPRRRDAFRRCALSALSHIELLPW